ncbi:hypothetical protein GYMLUDRAFT_252031 [Collybiopsis luxurians FD-317 M1]|uniref:Uncharacterized protein n=1 Tax=Collybiopsis luxurians FD-317 M1 TaxID=944289 RepID=A0A0D0BPK5_9AGAR|nr:hypothetical protein GYMLUDRAFT_252031 [Collybiopsis luxurians FD-317 M1]
MTKGLLLAFAKWSTTHIRVFCISFTGSGASQSTSPVQGSSRTTKNVARGSVVAKQIRVMNSFKPVDQPGTGKRLNDKKCGKGERGSRTNPCDGFVQPIQLACNGGAVEWQRMVQGRAERQIRSTSNG